MLLGLFTSIVTVAATPFAYRPNTEPGANPYDYVGYSVPTASPRVVLGNPIYNSLYLREPSPYESRLDALWYN